jgi:hypothetical protein
VEREVVFSCKLRANTVLASGAKRVADASSTEFAELLDGVTHANALLKSA